MEFEKSIPNTALNTQLGSFSTQVELIFWEYTPLISPVGEEIFIGVLNQGEIFQASNNIDWSIITA